MPLITKVKQPEHEEPEQLEKVNKRYDVRWVISVEPKENPSLYDKVIIAHKAVVVEDPPRKVQISFRSGEHYLVRKPWSYAIVHLTTQGAYLKSSIFFTYDQLESESERSLLLVPLTNITYTRLSYVKPCICLGRQFVGGTGLEHRAVHFNELFWGSHFNNEISIGTGAKPRWARYAATHELLKEWQSKSKRRETISFRTASPIMSSVKSAVNWLCKYID